MKAHFRRRIAAAAASVLVLAGAAACGGDDSDADGKVKMGYLPILNVATVIHADEAGLFEQAGVDVELSKTAGGAQAIPAMLAGDNDVTYTNTVSAILAAQQGLPIVIIASGELAAEDTDILVAADSPIQEIADLEGATFAVNALHNIAELGLREQLDSAGVDPDSVKLVELPFPDMAAALERGDIDAMWGVEPFQAGALAAGARSIGSQFGPNLSGMPITVWVTTKDFADKNPDTVKKLREAISASSKELQGNRELYVKVVPTYTEVPAAVVEKVALPALAQDLHAEEMQQFADLLAQYGLLEKPVDISSITVQ